MDSSVVVNSRTKKIDLLIISCHFSPISASDFELHVVYNSLPWMTHLPYFAFSVLFLRICVMLTSLNLRIILFHSMFCCFLLSSLSWMFLYLAPQFSSLQVLFHSFHASSPRTRHLPDERQKINCLSSCNASRTLYHAVYLLTTSSNAFFTTWCFFCSLFLHLAFSSCYFFIRVSFFLHGITCYHVLMQCA